MEISSAGVGVKTSGATSQICLVGKVPFAQTVQVKINPGALGTEGRGRWWASWALKTSYNCWYGSCQEES